ncbi:amidohydrolase family protein [Rhodocytophaga aerolata]|uniref:Amidohydrolase family protein n=1 Tax=Rhodocytophaga aerolata TaxID=455078 RepID=A0ABT8R2Q6_9BACT|nr:amidohydrolase family protein [Rhodocytophaga aerolata]MDO1446209.1 amidohydrolase family protein [Rhodocytophaga aerolata]
MNKKFLLLGGLLLLKVHLFAQVTFPRNGVYDQRSRMYAFTNATLHTDYQTTLEKATLLIKDGLIEAAGANLQVPNGYVKVDLQGNHIYPGLIDLHTFYSMPEVPKPAPKNGPQMESAKKGPYSWNQSIRPETNASEQYKLNAKEAEEMRSLGFGTVLSHIPDGIARGSATLITLHEGLENEATLKQKAAAWYSFNKGSSTQDYPTSLMGAIALLRQTYLDADWYKKGGSAKEQNLSLEAFNQLQNLPQFFEVSDKLNVLRADKLGDEFGIQYIIKGAGDEYQRIAEIKATNASLVIPVNFPNALTVDDPQDVVMIPIADMKHWELAPANPAALAKAGITFSLTSSGLKDKKDFWNNVRKAIQYGLPDNEALKALTYTPAHLIKADNQLGSLKKGMLANFIITSDNLFSEQNTIYENWVQGYKYVVNQLPVTDIRGVYDLRVGGQTGMKLLVSGKAGNPEFAVQAGKDTLKVKATRSASNLLTLAYSPDKKSKKGENRLSGWIEDKTLKGEGITAEGTPVKWVATYSEAFKQAIPAKKDSAAKADVASLGKVTYPFNAFGVDTKLSAENIIIKNAMVWTNEKEGKLDNTDVLIQNGKIAKVGKNLSLAGARTIDGTGKHLTAGIIDEHSHIGISNGVNEMAQAVTAEVRIGDVVNSEDINIYRQLAGGVVASQLLHGSANPIGGQSALIKLKWGASPEEMKIPNADGYIKFALGENVKQANWGEAYGIRFPQTRMGVEQVFMDAFTRAKEYEQAMKAYNSSKNKIGTPPRRDLELEALVEILNNKRFITCHSYVQSEINMLLHVADSMGFKVNTFTHILEGYKVADKMKAHGVGGSTFSDWWAYKMEVQDAIPYNAALMHKVGVTTAINSDDAEMGRRLNQEAGKTVKYGGVSEEEALKMVTLNPAKLLHLDNRMGSIKPGKDADIVLWSDHPLSIYARAEKTFVDGILYYDLERDIKLREELKAERNRIVRKMMDAKNGGAAAESPALKKTQIWHCEDIGGIEE